MLDKVEFNGLNDFIFKEIFKNKHILVAYLNVLLDLNLKEEDVEYHHSEMKMDIKAKGTRFDILVTLYKSRINLEAQRLNLGNVYQNHRKIHYASTLHSSSYKSGDDYKEDRKTYIIFLLDYRFNNSEEIYHITKYHNLTTNEVYDDIEILEILLKNIKYNDKMKLKERMLMVLSDYNISKYQNDKGIIKEVADMISHFNEDEKKKADARFAEDQERTYLSYMQQSYDEGHEKGMKQGIEQGIEQRSIEIAKSMLKDNLDISTISRYTGLSEEIIRKL